MIVVSNTSPLTNLAAINRIDLLRKLYGPILIADAVWSELNAFGRIWPGSSDVADADWISVHSVVDHTLVTALQSDLDRGEAETIALGIEQRADLILLDEQEGRRIARRFGLNVAGVIGILLSAKAQGFLPAIHPLLDALQQQAGFYMSTDLVALALTLADEQSNIGSG